VPRVKGKTENALLNLPFKAAYMFRPGVLPQYVTTTELLSRAMIRVARVATQSVFLRRATSTMPASRRSGTPI